jgi:hypothetical protein
MNCLQRRDLMPEYLLGLLSSEEMDALKAHLASGCPSCAAARSEAEAMLALLPEQLPTRPAPAAVRGRILARISAAPAGAPVLRVVPGAKAHDAPTPAASLFWQRSFWAALLCVGVLLLTTYSAHDRLQRKIAEQSTLSDRLDGLQHQITALNQQMDERLAALRDYKTRYDRVALSLASAQSTIGMLRSQNLVLVSLAEPGKSMQGPRARALWDKDTEHWQLIATGLKQPLNNRLYELWFITSRKQKVAAGTFTVDASGQAIMTVSVPRDIGVISIAAVTDEPGLMIQPTGAIALAGTL